MGTVLAAAQWRPRRQAHRTRILSLIGDYLHRRSRGRPDPVTDFLFTYYRQRPARLLRWHPGFGIVLAHGPEDPEAPEAAREVEEYAGYRGYHRVEAGVTADPAFLHRRRDTIGQIERLLRATAGRTAQLSCFGLHEWAMVYRSGPVRHPQLPLRLGRAGTDAVVDSLELRCTHYDAFRFFSPAAAPRNAAPLSRSTQPQREQPGCLHAAMDLYKFCYQLEPLIDSDLTADCFVLAHAARELDMRASPYDLSAAGHSPIRIETPAGRADYVRAQAAIAERAAALRARLADRCRELRQAEP